MQNSVSIACGSGKKRIAEIIDSLLRAPCYRLVRRMLLQGVYGSVNNTRSCELSLSSSQFLLIEAYGVFVTGAVTNLSESHPHETSRSLSPIRGHGRTSAEAMSTRGGRGWAGEFFLSFDK